MIMLAFTMCQCSSNWVRGKSFSPCVFCRCWACRQAQMLQMKQSDHLFLKIAIILGTQLPWACQCWWWIGTAMKADMLPSALHWCLRSISWTLGWCRCQRASAVARFLDDVAAAVPSEGSSSPERSPLSMIEAASFAGSDAHVVPFPHPPPHPNPIVNHDEGAALVWWGCSACVRAGTWTLLPHPPQNPKRI